jgi:hypothetical protein
LVEIPNVGATGCDLAHLAPILPLSFGVKIRSRRRLGRGKETC